MLAATALDGAASAPSRVSLLVPATQRRTCIESIKLLHFGTLIKLLGASASIIGAAADSQGRTDVGNRVGRSVCQLLYRAGLCTDIGLEPEHE